MDFLDKLLELLGMGNPEMGYDTIKEPGTTKPPLNKEQKKLMEELADTEVLADIYNAQRTMEQPQVELGARYMDKYRTEVPRGLASLMFQNDLSDVMHFGSAVPAGSPLNTSGGNYHQIKLKALEDLTNYPELRDKTIFHELGHIGEFITRDLIRAGVIPPSIAGDYNMISRVGGLGEGVTPHSAIHTMDDYYGPYQKYGKVGMRDALEPTEFDKEKVLSKLKSKTLKQIQAEINAEQKRVGKGNWSNRLTELVAERDRANASPTKSIEVTDAEAKDIVLAEQARVDSQNRSPAEQILDDIFTKDLEDRMVGGDDRQYLGVLARRAKEYEKAIKEKDSKKARLYRSDKNLADFLSERYGFDITDFSPENVGQMVDMMKRHTMSANELAEMIIENYPFGYIKEKVTDGY